MGPTGDSSSWCIGQVRKPPAQGQYPFSRWSLPSGIEKGEPIETHLQSLWRRVSTYHAQVVGLANTMKGYIAGVGYFKSHRDKFAISSGHFATTAYYQLNFDFNFYFDDNFGHEEEGRPYWKW